MMIRSKFSPATSRYGSHMGTCYHYPAMAEAWFEGLRDEAVCVQELDLEPAQMIEKAVAILRRRKYFRRSN